MPERSPQQIRELKVIVDQHKLWLVEMVDQVAQLLIWDFASRADLGVEIDIVLEHILQRIVLIFEGR